MELNRRHRVHELSLQEKTTSTVYRDSRSIFLRYGPVKKGRYVVVPSTFEPNQEAEFLLRVYTSAINNFMSVDGHCIPLFFWGGGCLREGVSVVGCMCGSVSIATCNLYCIFSALFPSNEVLLKFNGNP